jgi:hypothetical protein
MISILANYSPPAGGTCPAFFGSKICAPNVGQHLFSILNQQSDALNKGAILSVTEQKVRVRPEKDK